MRIISLGPFFNYVDQILPTIDISEGIPLLL